MEYFIKGQRVTQETFHRLFNDPILRSGPMYVSPKFRIKANELSPTFLYHYEKEIHSIQKKVFPDHQIKYLPISPGGELTVLSIVLSSFANIVDTIQDEFEHDLFSIESDRFRLTFRLK